MITDNICCGRALVVFKGMADHNPKLYKLRWGGLFRKN